MIRRKLRKRTNIQILATVCIALGILFMLGLRAFSVKESVLIDSDELVLPLDEEDIGQPEEQYIYVDIKGAVQSPGVYKMFADARLKDVVEKAGGFLPEADQLQVNLAQRLLDGQMIIIPKVGEDGRQSIADEANEKVRINYADAETLKKLPGIGDTKARAIIQYREEYGLFQTVDELLNVAGIGRSTLEQIQNDVTLY